MKRKTSDKSERRSRRGDAEPGERVTGVPQAVSRGRDEDRAAPPAIHAPMGPESASPVEPAQSPDPLAATPYTTPGHRTTDSDADLGSAGGGASGPGNAEPNWSGAGSGGATATGSGGGVTIIPTQPPEPPVPDKPRHHGRK